MGVALAAVAVVVSLFRMYFGNILGNAQDYAGTARYMLFKRERSLMNFTHFHRKWYSQSRAAQFGGRAGCQSLTGWRGGHAWSLVIDGDDQMSFRVGDRNPDRSATRRGVDRIRQQPMERLFQQLRIE